MNKAQATVSLFSILALAAACKKAEPELPAASGPQAAPMPKLPKISAGDRGGNITPNEGRTTGTTYPRQEAAIGPSVGGTLIELAVHEGDHVKKGDVLFRQDARDSALRAQQAKAALSAAEVQLRAIEVEYKRGEALMKDNAMNRAQWEQLQAKFDGAKVGVEAAQVALQMMEKMVNDAVVRAPFAGVVTQKIKNEGEMLVTMPPGPVLILQDQSTLELRFRLPEASLTRVKQGDHVAAKFEALGLERDATIIRVQPTVDARTRTVEVVAAIANTDLSLRPGLLVEVLLHDEVQAQGGQP